MTAEVPTGPLFAVVVTDEGRYSVWETGSPAPAGWHETGYTGPRADCLDHIERVWTDLRGARRADR